jgi:hypothetical protein
MKQTFLKLAIVLLTASLAGLAAPSFAGGSTDSGQKPPVDCKKKPDDPSCKDKK